MLIAFALPWLVWTYYRIRLANASPVNKSYWAYRAAGYYLHLCNIPRGDETPMQYASKTIDPMFGTSFTAFMNLYLKQKYANQELTGAELDKVSSFLQPFLKSVRAKLSLGRRLAGFLHPLRMLSFFIKPEDNE
jgi:hypothetical protein